MFTEIIISLMIVVIVGAAYYIGKIVATMQLLVALAEHAKKDLNKDIK
jgi:hypothetical protein